MTYNFEVAFSLCDRDLDIAQKINSRISSRVKTFLYSENQKDIMFTNMMKTFPNVYRNEARLVILLYRKEYGQSKWTAMEMDVIEDRFLNSMEKEFILLINLDGTKYPDWYPSKLAYGNYNESTFENVLMPAIENRLRQLGGNIDKETPVQRLKASKLVNELIQTQKEKTIGKQGLENRSKEVAKLKKYLLDQYEQMSSDLLQPKAIEEENHIELFFENKLRLMLDIGGTDLTFRVWTNSFYSEQRIKNLEEGNYVFTFTKDPSIPGWQTMGKSDFLTSKVLCDYWFHKIISYNDPR